MAKTSRYAIKTKEMIIEPVDDTGIWDCDWTITLRKDTPVQIGTATFRGEKALGAIPVQVFLDEEYRNRDYGTEIYKLLVDFAFGFRNIYEVKGTTDRENYKCVYALEKAGFVLREKNKNIETYSIKKPKTVWMGLYVFIGIICGLMLGVVLGSSWAGLAIGLVFGLLIGGAMDAAANKERARVTGQNE